MSFQLHAITTGKQELEQASDIASIIHPFVDYIHIREKHRSAKELFHWVQTFIEADVPAEKIIVNDRVDVALAAEAGGVQLTENSLPLQIVKPFTASMKAGCSIHEPAAAIKAESNGADWGLFGHIYPTASKPGRTPAGLEQLKAATRAVNMPIIAIGGIMPHHIQEVKEAGASGIAVMSGIFGSKDPADTAAYYRNEINKEEKQTYEYRY
ncbi:thiamine phosphate synthase [Bacillus sp. B190/17]|uniref:Thiamine phosphate synthase n=1 Tax=Bacillus lumedeiriae TaxID=3058829 RepID=A0ABW8I7J1_9BACI